MLVVKLPRGAVGAAAPLPPALVSALQYSPAHSTLPRLGRAQVARLESKVAPSASTSTQVMVKLLLLSVAPLPSCALAQAAALAGQVMRVLPTRVISPLSLVLNRWLKPRMTAAWAGAALPTTRPATQASSAAAAAARACLPPLRVAVRRIRPPERPTRTARPA